jgi:lipopolysaccharide export system protein LptA
MSVINKPLSLRLLALAVPLGILLSGFAQAQEMPSGQMSGPIDIQANEQEFSGDQVIARGNVRVTYKDSVILAPMAILTRDPAGKPQKAVFTGHPKLLQAGNSIDAETLTFDMVGSKILAQGRAHSEVISESSEQNNSAAPKTDKPATKKDKIVTDSDVQEYDRVSDKFEAIGHVRVLHGDILVNSDKLQLVYGANKKPETAIFTGNVTATQNQNSTSADTIAYSLTTKRLQATGHVRSKVIQQKAEMKKTLGQPVAAIDAPPAMATAKTNSGETETIIITSDAQDYSKETNRLSANGNVKVYYQDTVGAGPQAVLIRNDQGKAERMYFIGRSQITQPGRRWIADRISFTVANKKVLAEGNTKAIIIQKPGQATPSLGNNIQFAGRPAAGSLTSRKVNNTQ